MAGIPKLEGGCHSSLGSCGDISISHTGVSHGHRNVPHASVSHYTTSPDSSGLRRPPNRTHICSNGSFPSRPTSLPNRLNRAAHAHPQTISLHGGTVHNNATELASDLHTPNSVKSLYYINFWIYIYLTNMNDASLSNNKNTSVFFKNTRPTPWLLSPQEAATSNGGNHPWRLTRQPKQPRTTVYDLFRAQYVIAVPKQYPKYTIPCVRSLHLYFTIQVFSTSYWYFHGIYFRIVITICWICDDWTIWIINTPIFPQIRKTNTTNCKWIIKNME